MAHEQPGYRVYSVIERPDEEPFWLNLGLAFPHKDGKGFNVLLNGLPLDGKLVVRRYEESQAGGDGEAGTTRKRTSKPD
jgi:hypothetical protein